MSALSTKLRRDLVALTGQLFAIAVVIACGVAAYVSMRGCWKSLEGSRDDYYEQFRFADGFVHLSRAPLSAAARIAEIPGVMVVEPRLFERVRVPLPGQGDEAAGWALSLPDDGQPRLNALWVQTGRLPDPDRADEVVLLKAFADAIGLDPGDPLPVVLRGRLRTLRVTGLVDSPEFIFPVAPGELMPAPERLAVLWMPRRSLAPPFQMEGAFDDLVLRLEQGADPRAVLPAVDRILAPYGGTGAIARADQPSSKILEQEMLQLQTLALGVPTVFLAVAAFLIQVAMARIVELQRTHIATLKAFGYTRAEIARHYLGIVTVVALVGTLCGLGVGVWFGGQITALYAKLFHLPLFRFALDTEIVAVSIGASVGATVLGTLGTVLRVASLAPAEAMQPPAPPSFRPGLIERLGLLKPFPPLVRMTLRHLARQPLRWALSVLGVAAGTGVIVLGRFSGDALDAFEELLFWRGQRDDVIVTFAAPVPERALRSLQGLPGVRRAEGQRQVAVRFRAGAAVRDGLLIGHPKAPTLRRLVEWPPRDVPIPPDGVVITDLLGDILGLDPGDRLELEVRGGTHRAASFVVAGFVAEPVGLQAHGTLETVAAALGEPIAFDQAFLAAEPEQLPELLDRLREMPNVLAAAPKARLVEQFQASTAETRWVFVVIATAFGASLATAIVYNNARIALSSRSRELASLRVLGFGRGEVAAVLLGEQAAHLAVGVPLGWWLGHQAAIAMMSTADPDTWRFPALVLPRTYAFATAVILAAGLAAGGLVWRRIADLDLIGVLKTRE